MQYYPYGSLIYTIQYGDTLWIIAKRFNTTLEAIIIANPDINPENLYVGQKLYIPLDNGFYNQNTVKINNDIFNLSNHLRLLWDQLVVFINKLIISQIFTLPDLELIKNCLFENPKHFTYALLPFYGQEKVNQLQGHLNDHLKISQEFLEALIKKNHFEPIEKEWEINTFEIAQLLNSLNPHWLEVDWQKGLNEHIRLIKDEINFYINQDYRHGVSLFDELQRQAFDLADMMTNGIIKQFPKQFNYLRKKK